MVHHQYPTDQQRLQQQPIEKSNHQSSPLSVEDISWSVVSTPPTFTPCITTSGSQVSPRAEIIIEEPSEDHEAIGASSIEESFHDNDHHEPRQEVDGVIDLTASTAQPFEKTSSVACRTSESVSSGLTSSGTPPSVFCDKSILRLNSNLASSSPLLGEPLGIQHLRQPLFFKRSSTLSSSSQKETVPSDSSQYHIASHSTTSSENILTTANTIDASGTIPVDGESGVTFHHTDRINHLKTTCVTQSDHLNRRQHTVATTSSSQFFSHSQQPYFVDSIPFSYHSQFPGPPFNSSNPRAVPYVIMPHPAGRPHLQPTPSLGPYQHFNPSSPHQQSSSIHHASPTVGSFSLSEGDLISRQVARPAYGPAAAPTHHQRDYATDMTRVASAAYTKAMSDAARIQMMTAAQFAARPTNHQPIIIQNTTKAIAETQNESSTNIPPPRRSILDRWTDVIQSFCSSKLNRCLLIGVAGASLYLYWEWWQHHRRMQLMQRRIEANPLLKLGQILSGVADGQRQKTHHNYY